MSPKASTAKFRGKLAKPGRPERPTRARLGINPPRSVDDTEPLPEALNAWHAEALRYDLEGLTLLCAHHGIEQDDPTVRYMMLALHLARDLVPYFQPAARPRGQKVDRVNGLDLALDVADMRRRHGRTVRTDDRALMELEDRLRYRKHSRETLRKRLQRARKDPFVEVFLKIAEQLPAYRQGDGRKQLLNLARRLGQIT